MNDNEIRELSKQLRSVAKIELPKFKSPSIQNKGLTVNEGNKVYFRNKGYYSNDEKKLFLPNGETFKGTIEKGEIYTLVEGEYKWPSGQTFNGNFLGNNKCKGNLILKNGNTYDGELDYNNFQGKGKFKWNNKEYIDGIFENGKVEGLATLQKNNYKIEGNFHESKIEGNVNIFNVNSNGHSYVFPKFDFLKGQIEDLELQRDNDIYYLSNENVSNVMMNNRTEIVISDDDLAALNRCFNLMNNLIPNIELPSIPEEGLIVQSENFPDIEFTNNIRAKFDDDNDAYELKLPNGEKLEGIMNELGNNKYYIYEGKYTWPSGQTYSGNFNENNMFHGDDGDLSFKDEWTYKGKFENGKLKGHGTFEWSNGNKINAYFLNGTINGRTEIRWGDIIIEGNIKNSSIKDFEATIDNHTYKIQKIDKTIRKRKVIAIEKDENEYCLVLYGIGNNNEVILFKNNILNDQETNLLVNILKRTIEFPDIEPFSIGEDELILDNNIINFENGIVYNNETRTLLLPNKEKFKGELKIDSNNRYWLKEGEYIWPSGQKYIGTFNDKNNFEGNEETKIIFDNKCIYEGNFKNGEPNGKGKILWENGDNIEGNFKDGKVCGETYIKKNNISCTGTFINSIIKGNINNIRTNINKHNYKISSITIKNGTIEDEILNIEDDKDQKIEVKLNEENKKILSEDNYKMFEYNENEILALFKCLNKIRKIQLPYYKAPSFPENGLKMPPNINQNQTIKITFPNNERFKGKGSLINEKIIYEGEYQWPFGQKYIGTIKNGKFDSEKGELKYNNEWIYKGEFKEGKIEGYGEYQNFKNGEIIKGIFENGEIKKSISIKTKDTYFEGDNIDSINELYIKLLKKNVNNNNYEIYDYKINDDKMKINRGDLPLNANISKDLKLKMIESLLIETKTKTNKDKFYYHEPFKKEESKENKIKMLKIQDNINSKKLSKLSIYRNRLSNENRNIKEEIGKIIGVNLSQQISINELMYKVKATEFVNKEDAERLKKKIEFLKNIKELSKKNNNNEIEEKEILKICNNKLLKDMENEINLINQDINTLRKEREIIEKEKKDKNKEFNDLIFYYEKISDNYNELLNQKNTIENDIVSMEKNRKNVMEEKNYLVKYLNNIKNNTGKKTNKNGIINNKIKDLENENHKILKEISEKQEIINNGNKEKEELMKKIKEMEEIIEKQKKSK